MKQSLIVFLGSGLGGVACHLLNGLVTDFAGSGFPWGILIINVTGSLGIGCVAGWFAFYDGASSDVRLFLTTGILGGYTTFSAFSLDTALLYERGQPGLAATYVVASVALSILGVFARLWPCVWRPVSAYLWRQTLNAEITRIAARSDRIAVLGTTRRSWRPMKVPTTILGPSGARSAGSCRAR